MSHIKREDYAAQSFRYFFASAAASIATPIIGSGFLFLRQSQIDLQREALKLGAIEAILIIATILFWRSYVLDRKLLNSSRKKHMNTSSPKIDAQGIDIPDIDSDC